MDDLISRQAAIDAAIEAVDEWDGGYNLRRADMIADAINNSVPSAQPQLDTCPIYGGMCGYPSNLCYECPRHEGAKERPQWWTEGLQPFAQPKRIKGRWEIIEDWDGDDLYRCSECLSMFTLIDGTPEDNDYNFCPCCGARMEEEEDAVD